MDKTRILIIDDEPKNVKLLEAALATLGYETFKAYNGLEALQMLDRVNPHLIILDLNMPLMGGIAFYEKICYANVPRFPVFVLTARDKMQELFKNLHIEGFMTKPYSVEHLLEEIAIIISKKNGKQHELLKKKSKKVLIVDSDQATYDAIALTFINSGYAVSIVKTAVEAIELAFIDHPDILLMNITLPDLAGDETVMRLQQMPKTRDIRIVLYVYQSKRPGKEVLEYFSRKTGVSAVVETSDPGRLLKEVDVIFKTE